jgi:integrase
MRGTVERYGSGWRYRVELAHDPATGHRRFSTKGGFLTERDARRALNRVLVAIDDGVHPGRTRIVTTDYLGEWVARAKVDLKPTTAAGYGHAVQTLAKAFGAVRLQDLTPLMIEGLYSQLLDRGFAPKTVRNIHMVLHRALADAERLGLIARNPARSAHAPSVSRKEQGTWSPEQLSQFLGITARDPLHGVFVLLATTGMRRGEVVGLRWVDVDLDRGVVSVVHTITTVHGRPVESTTKTAKSRRRVSLDATSVAVLRLHRAAQREQRLQLGPGWADHGLVFCRYDGSPLHPDYVTRRFRTLVEETGLPRIRLHDLRHTYATLALQAGVHPKVVSERLGHATVGITLDLYSHVAPSLDQQAAEVVAGLLHFEPPSSGSVRSVDSE